MAELNKLIERILDEASSEAANIKREAEEKADKIIQNSTKQAEIKYAEIVEKGRLEAENLKDRMRSNANLRARDNELLAKQELITRVMEEALEDMKNIDDDSFISYIEKNADLSEGAYLIVPQDRMDLVKSRLLNVKISDERFVESGFIEVVGGIERNFTFDAQMSYIKDEVAGELARVLFR